jgi:predicted metal-binding membrane protein
MTGLAVPLPAEDTPRSAYGVLQRRATVATVAILLALAGIAWWSTVGSSRDMAAMVQGVASVGVATPFDMTVLVFMAMWTTMMVAMMFPTIAPIVLLHRMVVRRRGEGALPTVALVGGYLAIWALVGLVPLAGLVAFRQVPQQSMWVERAGGAVLLVAGAYQFTRWKYTCLRACRTPLSFLMTHDFGRGWSGALRVGMSHGLYCLGCCWALMAVLFVVGLMNLAWMAVIAVIVVAEKNWSHGVALTRVVGSAVLAFGVAVIVEPALLNTFVPAHSGAMMMSG